MTKLFTGLIITLYVSILSCNEDNSPTQSKQSNANGTLLSQVEELKKTIPETNRNSDNDDWQDNVYRNRFYKFRVEFPKNWEYDKGTTKTTIARALNREYAAAISVTVTHLPDKPKNPNNIFESASMNDYEMQFNELLAIQNTKAENFKIEKGALNNFPAYIIQFTSKVSSGTKSYIYISKQIQCYYESKIYQININLPEDMYDSAMNIFYNRVINSFNFEISY
jgi:ubiquitin-protein ligase